MAFQGSLKELPLPDIIQLVSVSGKTGKFTLSRDGQNGLIFLRGGQIAHAEVADLVGEEAIYALAIWNHGDFQFAAGEEPQRQTITKSNTNLLMEAARRADEWRVLSKKIASIDLVPELVSRESRREQVTLNPHEWTVLTKIDGQRSIVQMGKALGWSSFDVAKTLYGMITADLVHLKKKADLAHPGAAGGDLVELATLIRTVAERHLGESAQKSIDRYYRAAVESIHSGGGSDAIDTMITEFQKTASLLRGVAVTDQFRAEISRIVPAAS